MITALLYCAGLLVSFALIVAIIAVARRGTRNSATLLGVVMPTEEDE